MAEHLWSDVAAAYDRSFASLCAGTAPVLAERVPEGAAVLEVGCGSGHVTAALVAAGHRVDAVDPDPEMVALTRARSGVEAVLVVLATTWPAHPPPHGALWSAALDAAGARRPDLPRLAPELDFERSPDGLAGVLAAAGLEPREAGTVDWEWRVAPQDFWTGVTSVGNFGVTWRAQDEATRARIRAAYDASLGPWLDGERLAFRVSCVLVEAVVPAASLAP